MSVPIICSKNLSKQQYLSDAQYIVVKENLYHPDLGEYCTYGIQMKDGEYIDIIHDISTCGRTVINLAELFNRFQLSPVHLFDVVTDMLL